MFVKAVARLNNRAGNSHQPTREREHRMRGFRDPKRTQAFLSCFGPIRQHFALKRHLLRASLYRPVRDSRSGGLRRPVSLQFSADVSAVRRTNSRAPTWQAGLRVKIARPKARNAQPRSETHVQPPWRCSMQRTSNVTTGLQSIRAYFVFEPRSDLPWRDRERPCAFSIVAA